MVGQIRSFEKKQLQSFTGRRKKMTEFMIQKLRYTGYILPTSSDIKNKINWQKPVHNVIQRKFKENESDKNSNTKRN